VVVVWGRAATPGLAAAAAGGGASKGWGREVPGPLDDGDTARDLMPRYDLVSLQLGPSSSLLSSQDGPPFHILALVVFISSRSDPSVYWCMRSLSKMRRKCAYLHRSAKYFQSM
jgi:hypothetical protein